MVNSHRESFLRQRRRRLSQHIKYDFIIIQFMSFMCAMCECLWQNVHLFVCFVDKNHQKQNMIKMAILMRSERLGMCKHMLFLRGDLHTHNLWECKQLRCTTNFNLHIFAICLNSSPLSLIFVYISQLPLKWKHFPPILSLNQIYLRSFTHSEFTTY